MTAGRRRSKLPLISCSMQIGQPWNHITQSTQTDSTGFINLNPNIRMYVCEKYNLKRGLTIWYWGRHWMSWRKLTWEGLGTDRLRRGKWRDTILIKNIVLKRKVKEKIKMKNDILKPLTLKKKKKKLKERPEFLSNISHKTDNLYLYIISLMMWSILDLCWLVFNLNLN